MSFAGAESATCSLYEHYKMLATYMQSESRDIRNELKCIPGSSKTTDETVQVPETFAATSNEKWLLLFGCFVFCLALIYFTNKLVRRILSKLGSYVVDLTETMPFTKSVLDVWCEEYPKVISGEGSYYDGLKETNQLTRELDELFETVYGLPDQITLEHLAGVFGRKSNKIQLVCNKICHEIAEQSPSIVHVFAAYKKEYQYNLHFVVLFENKINSEIHLGYNCIHRSCNKDIQTTHLYSAESDSVLSPEESVLLKKTINENAVEYMDTHKYLSAISARKVVCEGTKETCIVMYVDPCTDKYTSIPLKEDPIPGKIGIYNVIIRHGVFNACIGHPNEHHSNVLMGCQITSDHSSGFGTVGGFIDHPEYGICGFTCAHVVCSKTQIHKLVQAERMKVLSSEVPCFVYQPDKDSDPIGRVVEVAYTHGDTYKAGVDLALFQIDNRTPISGRFPVGISDDELNYDTGRTWGKMRIYSSSTARDVQKFGSSTFCTDGQIMFDGIVVREPKYKANYCDDNVPIRQYNQYEIKGTSGDFCRLGDSGGLVFSKDHEGSLVCVGMIIGILDGITPVHGVVTPVLDILRELNVQSLKPFQNETIDTRLSQIEKDVSTILEKLEKIL